LNCLIMGKLAGLKKEEVFHRLQKNRISAAYLANVEDLFKSEQYRSHHYFVNVDHPIAGRFAYPGPFATMEGVEWKLGRAPLLSEHTGEILCGELGYSKQDLVRLRQLGVI
jgi:CoA:oxalate CoA-transferase